ncbi:glucose-6-phosphate isomerase [Patescibacteria group bacterium]|nr:glucose-6-phosphate isomerase [Patescibacteria group bacterium]
MKIQFYNLARPVTDARLFLNFQKNPPAFATLVNPRDLPADRQGISRVNSVGKFARANRKWRQILILGIGGSTLPAQVLIRTLARINLGARSEAAPEFFFLDNLDAEKTARIFGKLDWKKTLAIVITKSGGTLETLANFFVVKQKLGKNWRKQIVAITDADSGFLRKLATREKLSAFEISREVGGRFSIFSNVGLLPAALAGVNLRKLLAGAAATETREAFVFAGIHAAEFRRGKNISTFCVYSAALESLAKWWEQLLAESIGKNSRVGITPEIAVGATAQHSLLQLWADGPDDKFFIFAGVQNPKTDFKIPHPSSEFKFLQGKSMQQILRAEFEATVKSLVEKKRALATFEIPQSTEFEIGKLLQFWMLEVYFLGKLLGVNPLDQPGVERGKILARKLLS